MGTILGRLLHIAMENILQASNNTYSIKKIPFQHQKSKKFIWRNCTHGKAVCPPPLAVLMILILPLGEGWNLPIYTGEGGGGQSQQKCWHCWDWRGEGVSLIKYHYSWHWEVEGWKSRSLEYESKYNDTWCLKVWCLILFYFYFAPLCFTERGLNFQHTF